MIGPKEITEQVGVGVTQYSQPKDIKLKMKGRTLKKKSAHRQGMLKGKKGVKGVGRKRSGA